MRSKKIMENILIKENYNEYKQRVEELQGIIITAYFDYFYLIKIGEHKKDYRENTFTKLLEPAISFLDKIIRTIQKEFMLLVSALEDDDSKANSLKQLKANLNRYVSNIQNNGKTILKMPSIKQNAAIKARNKAIAHIEFDRKIEKVDMHEVKKRVDSLKECFNSYLFGDMIKFSIRDQDIKKIESKTKAGVDCLLSGMMDAFYLLHKRIDVTIDGDEE